MSKISRFAGNLLAFAKNALAGERTVFGDTSSSDILNDNLNTDFFRGWGITGPNDFPTKQDFNALGFTLGQLLAYLHQMGIPEWDDEQEYFKSSICLRPNGNDFAIYMSKTDSNIGNDPNSSSNWFRLFGRIIDFINGTSEALQVGTDGAKHLLKGSFYLPYDASFRGVNEAGDDGLKLVVAGDGGSYFDTAPGDKDTSFLGDEAFPTVVRGTKVLLGNSINDGVVVNNKTLRVRGVQPSIRIEEVGGGAEPGDPRAYWETIADQGVLKTRVDDNRDGAWDSDIQKFTAAGASASGRNEIDHPGVRPDDFRVAGGQIATILYRFTLQVGAAPGFTINFYLETESAHHGPRINVGLTTLLQGGASFSGRGANLQFRRNGVGDYQIQLPFGLESNQVNIIARTVFTSEDAMATINRDGHTTSSGILNIFFQSINNASFEDVDFMLEVWRLR